MVEIGYRAVRVRTIFTLPRQLVHDHLTHVTNLPTYYAYVELFTLFEAAPRRHHGLFSIKHEKFNQQPVARIIPINNICSSVHLFPKFGPTVSAAWASENVLDEASTFYLNVFSDRHVYYLLS